MSQIRWFWFTSRGPESNQMVLSQISQSLTLKWEAYNLHGAGMHSLNGVGPKVAIDEYTTYVLPSLLYVLEALVLERSELEALELHHRKNLHYLQHLPESTTNQQSICCPGYPPLKPCWTPRFWLCTGPSLQLRLILHLLSILGRSLSDRSHSLILKVCFFFSEQSKWGKPSIPSKTNKPGWKEIHCSDLGLFGSRDSMIGIIIWLHFPQGREEHVWKGNKSHV